MTAITLYDPQQGHNAFTALWRTLKPILADGKRLVLKVEPERRSSEQNRLLWAALTDLSEQVDWYGNKLTAEEWKAVMTAALKKQKVVPGIDGGFVVLGTSTSRMSKAEFSELMELIFSFGTDRGVTFKEQA